MARKVTGEALYASDVPVRNPAFAFLVTSPIAKGRIDEIDLGGALAVPGVLDVLTYENTKLKEVKFPFAVAVGRRRLGKISAPKSAMTVRSLLLYSPIRSRRRAKAPIEPKLLIRQKSRVRLSIPLA